MIRVVISYEIEYLLLSRYRIVSYFFENYSSLQQISELLKKNFAK